MTTEDPEAAAPQPAPPSSSAAAAEADSPSAAPLPQLPDSFDSLALDARLLRGLSKMGISKPTAVQALTIPAALEGRDIVARARTGSGKTLAFLLPAFHAVARLSAAGDPRGAVAPWRALALVPTRELAEQVADVADALAAASGVHLRTSTLAASAGNAGTAAAAPTAASTNALLSSSPRECLPPRCGQLVVSTPGRLASALKGGKLTAKMLSNLSLLAVDEADLLLSLPGYAADLAATAAALPRSAQRLLLSATSAAAVDELGALMLQDPVRIDATGYAEGGGGGANEAGENAALLSSSSLLQPPLAGVATSVSHFYLEAPDASDAGKLATLIALLKLGAAKRRVLVFVADDDEGIKLKLALAAFGVRAARLGAALPLNSRHHALQEFNRGVYDYLIATDDGRGDSLCSSKKDGDEEEDGDGEGDERRKKRKKKAAHPKQQQQQQQRKSVTEEEGEDFGVVRGIDFSGVRTVVNYSVPRSATSYVHRAGRTGRAGARGAVVTLFSRERGKAGGESEERAALEAALVASSAPSSTSTSNLRFRLFRYPRLPATAAAALRYRVDDVARALTKPALREARAQELRRELLNSSRLAAHFSAAPRDLALLRHDAPLSAAGRAAAAGGGGLLGSGGGSGGGGASHLKRLPSYLMAAAGLRGKAAAAAVAAAASSAAGRRASSSGTKKRTRDDGDPLRGLAAEKKQPSGEQQPAEKKKPAQVFFDRAPKRGGGGGEGEMMTPAERKAQIEGEKAAKKLVKKQAPLLVKVAAAAQLKNAIAKKHRRR